MPTWPADWFQSVTQGRWLSEPPPGLTVTGVSIDTRTLKPDQAFVAIRGENFDGHDYVGRAFEQGASIALVQDRHEPKGDHPVLSVPDPVLALQQLAHAHRDALAAGECRVVSVSGSNGKTTTRHLIHHVLTHAGLTGTQSLKSFNNHLGVPLTLLAANPADDFVACEIGTNHPGEIDALGAIARPDIAVITSIGEEHLEFFIDLDGVAREERAVLDHLQPKGCAICDREVQERFWAGDTPDFDVRLAEDIRAGEVFCLPGPHNATNARLTAEVARCFRVRDTDAFESALTHFTPPGGRLDIRVLSHDVTVIDDTYNANPSSMKASLHVLAEVAGRARRVAVLGDMYELGQQQAPAHATVAGLAQEVADLCVFVGELFDGEPWTDDLPEQIADMLQPGDVVLLKASRGMRLERLIPAIEARFGPAVENPPT